MEISQIKIHSTSMKIGLDIQQPVQQIEQSNAKQHIEQPAAILEIETEPGKFLIDQSQAQAEVGLKSIPRLVKESAEKGYQDWLKGLARVARQGRELMEIHNGGNPIAAHAKENSKGAPKQFNIGWIPSHFSVKLQYEPAEVKINVEPQKPIIKTEVQKPIIEYRPGDVTVEILEKNSLDIEFIKSSS